MNGRLSKKLHRIAMKKSKANLEDLMKLLNGLGLWWRVIYAIRLVLKWNPKAEFEQKKGNR